jgi:DNA-binding winged helix-turn-helix (wHTH) protein
MSEGLRPIEPLLTFGPFTIDRRSLELRREGQLVRLQQQPARVLVLLVERAGDMVTREELWRSIWGDDVVVDFDRGLNFCISQIRRVLAQDATRWCQVETLRGRGYRFIARGCPAQTPASPISLTQRMPARQWWLPPVIGAALLMGLGGLSSREGRSPSTPHPPTLARLAQSGHPNGVDSGAIAIRPGTVPGSWLESRVDRRAGQYRVTLTLREADGSVRWSDAFDGQLGDWINAREEMSQIIAQARYPIEDTSRTRPYVQSLPSLRSSATSEADTTGAPSVPPPQLGTPGSTTSMFRFSDWLGIGEAMDRVLLP